MKIRCYCLISILTSEAADISRSSSEYCPSLSDGSGAGSALSMELIFLKILIDKAMSEVPH